MLITRPSHRARIDGSTASVQYSAPFRFASTTRSNSDAARSLKKRFGMLTPAQLTRISTRPWRWRIARADSSTASRSVTSTASASAWPPKRPIRSWVSASAVARRPVTTTFAPARAISTAAAWPMPLPPPVTHAILPARLMRGLVGRTYHDGPGELVVPPLLALVEGDPQESEARRKD